MSETLLVVDGVRKTFPVRRSLADLMRRRPAPTLVALDGVSVSVQARRTLGIVGESGSGKSTLAKSIVRLLDPDEGQITYRDTDVLAASGEELRHLRRRVQIVYQDPYSSLNPRMAIGKAILEPARVHGLVTKDREGARLAELMEQVGLPKRLADRRPRSLSGGQRQRVAIARALATQPEVLIADEVVSALDVSIQAQVLNLLTEMQRELGLTMIFISHNLPVVGHVADEVAVMYLGRVVESGPTREVFARPAHPYTAALLAAQPSREHRMREKVAVKGEIPSAMNIPRGCRFRTRCPIAQDICREVDPPRAAVSTAHGAWCHFAPGAPEGARAEAGAGAGVAEDVTEPA